VAPESAVAVGGGDVVNQGAADVETIRAEDDVGPGPDDELPGPDLYRPPQDRDLTGPVALQHLREQVPWLARALTDLRQETADWLPEAAEWFGPLQVELLPPLPGITDFGRGQEVPGLRQDGSGSVPGEDGNTGPAGARGDLVWLAGLMGRSGVGLSEPAAAGGIEPTAPARGVADAALGEIASPEVGDNHGLLVGERWDTYRACLTALAIARLTCWMPRPGLPSGGDGSPRESRRSARSRARAAPWI
jgi:hypothetical protein